MKTKTNTILAAAACLGVIATIVAVLDDSRTAVPDTGRQAPAKTGERRNVNAPLRTVKEPARSAAVKDPPGAPGPSDDDGRRKWLAGLQSWGMKNPLIASRWAIENLSPEECWSFLGSTGGIAFQLGAQDMQRGLSLLQQLRKWDGQKVHAGWEDGETMYTALMAKFAAGAVASDPDKAIQLARESGIDSLYMLAGHWAELDAQKATEWVRSLTDAKELGAVVTAISASLGRRGKVADLVHLLNSLTEKPAAYDKAVTTMLQSLPGKELGPLIQSLQTEPPSDAAMVSSWINGIRGNFKLPAVRKAEILSQLVSGLGEEWRNDPQVKAALGRAVQDCAENMWRGDNGNLKKEGFRDAVNYLATGGGGIIPPEVQIDRWSPLTSTWLEWCQASPAEAVGWLGEGGLTEDQRRALVGELDSQAKRETVAAGIAGANYQILLDNQGVFRLMRVDRTGTQQFTYTNGQWNPPLPQDWQALKKDFGKSIEERQNLQSALQQLGGP